MRKGSTPRREYVGVWQVLLRPSDKNSKMDLQSQTAPVVRREHFQWSVLEEWVAVGGENEWEVERGRQRS